jgi:hypothetical protein
LPQLVWGGLIARSWDGFFLVQKLVHETRGKELEQMEG